MLSSTNNCSQHQWVLNLMRFIIIEIEHTNLVSVQGTVSFENVESLQYRHIGSGSLAFLSYGNQMLYFRPRSLTSQSLQILLHTLLLVHKLALGLNDSSHAVLLFIYIPQGCEFNEALYMGISIPH